jgi:N-acetylneuraminic acid mutarotase
VRALQLVLFGGVASAFIGATWFRDTWAYDPQKNTWADLKPRGSVPSPRIGFSMLFDPATNGIILFGGVNAQNSPLGDLWTYDSAENTWIQLRPNGPQPSARTRQVMVYNPVGRAILLFGGGDSDGHVFNDTWAYYPG